MFNTIEITNFLIKLNEANFFWILIPIFFIGIITDKYQEEFKTNIGSAISNGALVIFSAFSWLEVILSRVEIFPIEFVFSQLVFTFMIMIYGFAIIVSSFETAQFAQKYGRIRVITFMLMYFTIIIYIPELYNYTSLIIFCAIFPFYYAIISKLIKILPYTKDKIVIIDVDNEKTHKEQQKKIKKIKKSLFDIYKNIKSLLFKKY